MSLDNVKHRMKLLYDKSDEHRGDVRMLMMLVYVPDQDIPVRGRNHSVAICNFLFLSVCMM